MAIVRIQTPLALAHDPTDQVRNRTPNYDINSLEEIPQLSYTSCRLPRTKPNQSRSLPPRSGVHATPRATADVLYHSKQVIRPGPLVDRPWTHN